VWESLEEHRKFFEEVFNLRDILAFLMRLVMSMLGCFSILSKYLWLSLLISFLTYSMLRSCCNVSLVTLYHESYSRALILGYLFWNLCNISIFELETVLYIGPNRIWELSYIIAACFQLTVMIAGQIASTFFSIEIQVIFAGEYIFFSNLIYDRGIILNI